LICRSLEDARTAASKVTAAYRYTCTIPRPLGAFEIPVRLRIFWCVSVSIFSMHVPLIQDGRLVEKVEFTFLL
jgi:hypothetical protein